MSAILDYLVRNTEANVLVFSEEELLYRLASIARLDPYAADDLLRLRYALKPRTAWDLVMLDEGDDRPPVSSRRVVVTDEELWERIDACLRCRNPALGDLCPGCVRRLGVRTNP